MAKAKRPKVIAPEWRGFSARLGYAVEARQRESELSQNDIAAAAGIDSGQLSKILSGERATGVQANTVILLATALQVRPLWLLTGVEPSGLGNASAGRVEPTGESPAPPRIASR